MGHVEKKPVVQEEFRRTTDNAMSSFVEKSVPQIKATELIRTEIIGGNKAARTAEEKK